MVAMGRIPIGREGVLATPSNHLGCVVTPFQLAGYVREQLAHGRYVFKPDARTTDGIGALGGNGRAGDERLAVASRVFAIDLKFAPRGLTPAAKALAHA